MLISIATGFIAGSLHVVGGADHLIAIAPAAFNRPRIALRNALAWGAGHSTGVLLLSLLAILIKDLTQIERMSSLAELSVGVILLIAGAFAIKTAFGLNIHTHHHNHGEANRHQHVHLHMRGMNNSHGRHSHAATSLGVLHGIAGASHLFAVLPALALPPIGAFAYMAAYLIGSVFSMGAVVLAMSLAAMRSGRRALPLLVGFTGGISIVIGFFWVQKTSSYFL